jgi:lipopolysaccharide export system permease protein
LLRSQAAPDGEFSGKVGRKKATSALRRILDRYILREVFWSWLAVTGGLLVVLLTDQLARTLERAAENQYPQSVVFELIWLATLQNLAVLMPIGLLLGVVLAFGRLYHDSEMAAALACGVGPKALYVPVSIIAGVVTIALATLTLYVGPHALARTLSLRSTALQQGQFAPIAPGRFRTFGSSDAVVYAENVEADGTLTNVFVERDRGGRVEVALAHRARHSVDGDGMAHTITLYDGERFEGVPGSPRFRIVRFEENTIPVEVPKLSDAVVSLEATTTSALLTGNEIEKRAELHWRIAMPVMCIVLTLIAIPLSRLRPREGRYARVVYAILIYIVYTYVMSAAKVWIARGTVPEWLGLWWVHVLVGGGALLIFQGPLLVQRLRYRPVAA